MAAEMWRFRRLYNDNHLHVLFVLNAYKKPLFQFIFLEYFLSSTTRPTICGSNTKNVFSSTPVHWRSCSDFLDMLRRLRNCRIIIVDRQLATYE